MEFQVYIIEYFLMALFNKQLAQFLTIEQSTPASHRWEVSTEEESSQHLDARASSRETVWNYKPLRPHSGDLLVP